MGKILALQEETCVKKGKSHSFSRLSLNPLGKEAGSNVSTPLSLTVKANRKLYMNSYYRLNVSVQSTHEWD